MAADAPLTWAITMRRAETAYWVSIARFIRGRGGRWTYRKMGLIAGVSGDTVKRRLALALDGSGETTGAWLAKALQDDWEPTT